MLTGNGLAFLAPFLALTILGRLYSPETFGQFGVFMTILGLFTVIGALRYEQAILLPKEDIEAIGIIKLGFRIILLITLVLVLFVAFFRKNISNFYDDPTLATLLLYIPIIVLFNGVYILIYLWNNRLKRYNKIATIKVYSVISIAMFQVVLGYLLKGNVHGLVIGYFSSFIVSLFFFRNELIDLFSKFKDLPVKKEKQLALEYIDFPKVNLPHALSDIFFQQFGFNTLFSKAFGMTAFGFYHVSQKYIRSPIKLINASMSQVFYQEASSLKSKERSFTSVINSTLKLTAPLSVVLFLILVFWAPVIFGFLMGKEWLQVGIYAQYLAPAICLNFIVSPVSTAPIICQKQKFFFWLSLVHQFFSMAVFILCYKVYDMIDIHAILGYSLTSSFFYIIMLIWFYKISKI